MNKADFIREIMRGFPDSFKGLDFELEKNKYNIAIEDNLDYDKLYTLFIKDWKYRTAPAPAYFDKFFSQCRAPLKLITMPSARRADLVKVANWFNSPAYITCLYERKKAPPEIRELIHKNKFTPDEIDQARISGQLGEGDAEWN